MNEHNEHRLTGPNPPPPETTSGLSMKSILCVCWWGV